MVSDCGNSVLPLLCNQKEKLVFITAKLLYCIYVMIRIYDAIVLLYDILNGTHFLLHVQKHVCLLVYIRND